MKIKGMASGVAAAAFVWAALGVTPAAKSITINLTFDALSSDSPSFDPGATLLTPIIQAAANFWEDIIEDTWTINVEYYYDNLSDPNGTLAVHNNLATSGGKPTSARVRVDTQLNGIDRLWFFDPTPTNNSEYNLQQTLYRDLTGTQQTNWFNGAPPALLEVGYRGNTAVGAPANAVNGFDLLSTVIHELGHAVGLTGNVASGQVADGDYDFNTAFVNGAVMSVDDNGFHIDPTVALMCSGCGATNLRRMPTATDVFAAASAAGWTQIDLPRQDFLGGTNWGTAGNWEANQVPGAADWAFLRNGGNIQLNIADSVAQLLVAEGTDLFTNANRLDVNGTATVEHDGVAARPQVFVEAGGELEANRLDLNGGELDMTGGLADINGILDINTTNGLLGRITGNGSVDVLTRLDNDGEIVPDGGTLTFTSAAANPWNLDGGGGGIVNASIGDINFNSGGLADAFDGTMTVGVGHSITFVQGWEHGSGGVLNLNGGAVVADRAKVDGGAMIIRGDINVNGFGELDGQTTFHSTADVSIGTNDRLDLGNAIGDTIVYNGGNFTGNGKLVQDGDATVTAGSTVNISVNTFDFDGDTISDTTIEPGATMNITGTGIADAHNGVITINSGTLNVATGNTITLLGNPIFLPAPWEMAGSLIFLDNGTNPVLSGSKVNITGAVSVPITGTGVINAPVEFHPTSNTEITSASDKLELNGLTTYSGGSYTGFGTIQQNGNATVSSATTIAVGKFDMDGSVGTTTITLNSDLTVNSTHIDSFGDVFNGTIVISDSSSELTINTAAPWTMAGTLNVTTGTALTFPSISGQDFTFSGTANIDGGTRFGAKVDLTGNVVFATNTSRLAVLGGDLASPNTINGASINGPAGSSLRTTSGHALVGNGTISVRLDFLAGSELLADNGTLSVPGNFISMGVIGTNDADGVLNVTTAWNTNTATELQLNGGAVTGASITNGGQVSLIAGDIAVPSFTQSGTMTVNVLASNLSAVSSFEAGSTTTLGADLNLLGDTLVRPGAGFSGAGSLNVTPGTTWTALDGAVLGVKVNNDGSAVIGSSPGTVVVNDYVQTATGDIQIELSGLLQGAQFDYLKVVNAASIDGLMNVVLLGGFLPNIGDSFEIIAAGSGINGVFNTISFPVIPNIGLGVSYTANVVTLNAGLLGDLDGDGFVGINDLNIVLGAWNGNVTPGVWTLGDPSGDGFIGIEDLNVVLGNWNAGTPPLAEASGVIPEPASLGMLGCGVFMLVKRSRA